MGFPEFPTPDPLDPAAPGPNMLRKGLAWLTGQLVTAASEPVVYVDQEGSRVACQAVVGSQLLKLSDEMGGFRMERTDADFLIRAADLVPNVDPVTGLGGLQITPTRGDQILRVVDGNEQTYEVLPYGGTEACWRWSDPIGQTLMRIHTKLVDVEPYT